MIRTRFAPSPNGPLHLGHAYAALMAHDLVHDQAEWTANEPAKATRGEFLLRIEDIDGARSRNAHVEGIFADLTWLGLKWDGAVVRQSERQASYAAAGERLRSMGLLYPCICKRAEIAGGIMGPDGPVYRGTCKGRDVDGAEVAWRLDMEKATGLMGPLMWHDALAGEQMAKPAIFGDVILLRKAASASKGEASYHLAATLDDAADGVSLVTRGQDLFVASHIHRLLQALLDLPVPRWHHHGLLIDPSGRKLAKRRGSPALADLRLAGVDGHAVVDELRAGRFPDGISLQDRVGAGL